MQNQRDIDFSFIVVNYQAEKQSLECMRSLTRFTSNQRAEFILVDNSPVLATAAAFPDIPALRYIASGRNLGFGTACNVGMKASSGRYVFFLNPDVVYESGDAEEFIHWMDEHPEVGAVGPKILNPDGSRQFSCRSFPGWMTAAYGSSSILTKLFPGNSWTRTYLRRDLNGDAGEVDWVSGCCFVGRREAIEAVGGFDSKFFMFFEDVDLCQKLKLAGWKRMYYPGLRLFHEIGISRAHLLDRGRRHHYRSAARYFIKQLFRDRWWSRRPDAGASATSTLGRSVPPNGARSASPTD